MRESYFFQCSGGLILFVGHPDIIEKPFLKLTPGDKITQVGLTRPKDNPGQAGINRTDEFRPYITYKGTRLEPDMAENQNFLLMFEVREEDKPVAVLEDDNFYIAYIVLFHENNIIELKTYDHRIKNFRVYKPEFVKFEEDLAEN